MTTPSLRTAAEQARDALKEAASIIKDEFEVIVDNYGSGDIEAITERKAYSDAVRYRAAWEKATEVLAALNEALAAQPKPVMNDPRWGGPSQLKPAAQMSSLNITITLTADPSENVHTHITAIATEVWEVGPMLERAVADLQAELAALPPSHAPAPPTQSDPIPPPPPEPDSLTGAQKAEDRAQVQRTMQPDPKASDEGAP